MICRDSGEGTIVLYECNTCPRVMCSKCIEVPHSFVDVVQQPNISFFCLACHSKATLRSPAPFYVSNYFFAVFKFMQGPQGFFKDGLPGLGGKEVLPSFLRLNGKYEMASSSVMAASPITIIHFILGGEDTICTPVSLICDFLGTFYPNGGSTYTEVAFNVTSHKKIDEYEQSQVDRVAQITRHLARNGRVIVFFSDHSEQDCGWLYGGQAPKEDGSGVEYVAMDVSHVSLSDFSCI